MNNIKIFQLFVGLFSFMLAPPMLLLMVVALIWGGQIIDEGLDKGSIEYWLSITLCPASMIAGVHFYLRNFGMPLVATAAPQLKVPPKELARHIKWVEHSLAIHTQKQKDLSEYLEKLKNQST